MKRSAIERFSEACGVGGLLRLELVANDGSPGGMRAFAQPFLVIGRSENADLPLDHPSVSRRHCYIQVLGGRVFVVDLGSQTGVRLGGTSRTWGWTDSARPLEVGPFQIQIIRVDSPFPFAEVAPGLEELNPLVQNVLQSQVPSAAVLEISGAIEQPRRWRMSRGLALIGRAPECQIRLQHPRISWFHSALVRTPSGVWLVDLASREGTIVDGERVRAVRLDDGCEARIGLFSLRLGGQDVRTALQKAVDPAVSVSYLSGPGREVAAHRALPDRFFATPVALPHGQNALMTNGPDALQQTVMALAQALVSMHRDQMALVRDELAEVRKLAEELRALRAEHAPRTVDDLKPAAPMAIPQRAPTARERPDPELAMAIANDFLEAYRHDRHSAWNTFVRMFTSLTRAPSLGPATRSR